jgi:hypothetical protein
LKLDGCTFANILLDKVNTPSLFKTTAETHTVLDLNRVSLHKGSSLDSENGGAISFYPTPFSHLLLNLSIFSSCEASQGVGPAYLPGTPQNDAVVHGHGGFVFIDSDYQLESSSSLLNFIFKKDTFVQNKATCGRDIFIECFTLEKQINDSLFEFSFEWNMFNTTKAILGMDSLLLREGIPKDLISSVEV